MSATREGHAYVYINVGTFGRPGHLGRVFGFMGEQRMGVEYVYQNVLAQQAGSARTLEDGVDRHLEDGTTTRTLE